MTSTSGTAGDEWRSVRVEQSTLRRFALALSPSPESIWLLCEFWAAAAAATEAEANGVDDDLGRAPLSWLSDEEDEDKEASFENLVRDKNATDDWFGTDDSKVF